MVEKISISLPRDMVEDIKQAVDRGAYATTSEVLRDAVRDWQKKNVVDRYERLRARSKADLKCMVQEGIASADRGEVAPLEEVADRLIKKYAAMARVEKKKPAKSKRRKT
ncbi:MAG TPA: ribbon-helix-helix protein, CopG family [Rhizomicrobium sp.]|jgi:antitoxin ParD1/3/4